MTENGRTGPSPQVLAAMRGEDPYENIPQPEGPYYPQPRQADPEPPAVFDAANFWQVGYNFKAAGVDAEGEVPMPSQAKVDRYLRREALLRNEQTRLEREVIRPYERMQDEYDEAELRYGQARRVARNAATEAVSKAQQEAAAKWKAEMERIEDGAYISEEQYDTAAAQRTEIISRQKDAVAELCSKKPTRAQLEKLPDNIFIPFKNYVEGHLNPNS